MSDTSDPKDGARPDAEELPDGSGSDSGGAQNEGADTASGGGADDD